MTEYQFKQQCIARLSNIGDDHPDIKARTEAFNEALADMRQKHAVLMDKDYHTIHDVQCRAILIDANEGKAVYHKNIFGKTFYKYNKQKPLCQ